MDSWNDGIAKSAILEFVERVSSEGTEAYVAPAERIAVIDNDGTLWCERPAYAQALFLLAQLRKQAAERPELAARPLVKALLAGDLRSASRHGPGPVAEILLGMHAGLTPEEFEDLATHWFDEARHPRFGVPFRELTYAPMIELLDLLRAREFRVFVVTGGGAEFVRTVSEQLYDVSPDDVVGSAAQMAFERRRGRAVLVRGATLLGLPNEGAPKPVNIQAHIGRRPIFAAGNSAGDREMLEYTEAGVHPSLCMVVNHDDPEREYAYSGSAATDPTARPILETATRRGWTVVSMRADWQRVFRSTSGA
jgi:phosphoglycolate phosphatase-like HAD superfamily hydrolase